LACPYFVPDERCEAELWQHRARLPLGDGFVGSCRAPGADGARPDDQEIRTCNVGYPRHCARAPQEREIDAVRFAVAADEGSQMILRWACERQHRPVMSGELQFVFEQGSARAESVPEPDWVLAMAQCYANAYLTRNPR
jgi:hypothetical protein